MNIITGIDSGRQLISNLSDQPISYSSVAPTLISAPVFIGGAIIVGVILGLLLGRRRVVSLLISQYIVAAFVVLAPFSQSQQTQAIILACLFLALILFFVLPGHLSGNRYWFMRRWWTVVFGLLNVYLLIFLLVLFSPANWLTWISSDVVDLFNNKIFRFVGVFAPLILLWLAARKNDE